MSQPFIFRSPGEPARLVLHPPVDPYGDGDFTTLRVELLEDGMTAQTVLTLAAFDSPPLVGFLDDLAAGWQGWTGVRAWRSLDGELQLDASHDGRGHVSLGVTVKRAHAPYADDAWSARAVFHLEAGAQMTQLAADVAVHLDATA